MTRGLMVVVTALALVAAGDDGAAKGVREAIAKVRDQKGCRVEFSSAMTLPASDAMTMKGTAIMVNPDILYLDFTGSGEQKIKILRKGKKALQWHPVLEEWLDPLMVEGEGQSGGGIYDMNAVMETLSKNLGEVKEGGDGKVGKSECRKMSMTFSGDGIRKIMAEQDLDPDTVQWDRSTADVTLWIGKADGLVHRFSVAATVIGNRDELMGEKIAYEADVTVMKYNEGIALDQVPADVKKRVGLSE